MFILPFYLLSSLVCALWPLQLKYQSVTLLKNLPLGCTNKSLNRQQCYSELLSLNHYEVWSVWACCMLLTVLWRKRCNWGLPPPPSSSSWAAVTRSNNTESQSIWPEFTSEAYWNWVQWKQLAGCHRHARSPQSPQILTTCTCTYRFSKLKPG